MTEKFISYSQAMVKARRAGIKTHTRRVCKNKIYGNGFHWDGNDYLCHTDYLPPSAMLMDVKRGTTYYTTSNHEGWESECPYGLAGDVLIVKEAVWMWCESVPNGKTATGRDKVRYVPMREAPLHYQADHPEKPLINVVSPDTGNQWGWRLKIPRFVPRWACRGRDEIVSVRVERLQDISEIDAMREGIHVPPLYPDEPIFDCRRAYQTVWENINGEGSWKSNPYVWVLEFRVITP